MSKIKNMKKITLTAPAKINLCLEVIKRYDNGFHELRSIMMKSQKLYDTVVLEFDENGDNISIECDHPDVPTDAQNICWKIAEGFFEKIGKWVGVKIIITKRIPMLAGLGGGSSDGASVLLVLNEYFGDILNDGELVAIASEAGKDIPFFLQDAFAAYVSGAGEGVESLFNFPQLPILVINPKVAISTPWAYGELDKRQWFMNDVKRKNVTLGMKENSDVLDDIVQYVYNDFDFVAREQCTEIGEIQNAMRAFGARAVSISGKGPTVFGIFESREELEKVQKTLKNQYKEFFVSEF